ncbi:MAG: restriction endonuclease subunit S [Deltaproteobacteria bacterium]|nr:restriction endonuclease subunit S [Deltaproteobacteria bacterium]
MNMNELTLPADWQVKPIREAYTFTHKPRGLRISAEDAVAFLPMDAIPIGRVHVSAYEERLGGKLSSGTYIENGDLLVAKITPSFENGKQAIVDWQKPFGFATTEVIPLQEIANVSDKFYLFHLLLHPEIRSDLAGKMEGTTGRQRLSKAVLGSRLIPLPPLPEQQKIAAVLGLVQRAIEQQERLIALTTELKKTLLHQLFTQGLRGEPQKETEIGLVPESWNTTPLGACCDILSGSLSYTDFLKMESSDEDGAVECMGVKVSDMNLPGNESRFVRANLSKRLPVAMAERKLIPSNTVVFPKRGAAIATNKKRLTTTWTVLDPNLIGVRAKDVVDPEFLFHWSQTFDLRKITDPGTTPQLNKKDLVPVLLPLPKEIEEQREIAHAISCVDNKLRFYQQKLSSFTDLFRTLLHQLMMAQIRVDQLDLSHMELRRQ